MLVYRRPPQNLFVGSEALKAAVLAAFRVRPNSSGDRSMTPPILGLHHVTATVDDAQADLDFSLAGLGLRLVRRRSTSTTTTFSISTTATNVARLEPSGRPFPTKGRGVPVGKKGAGQITVTSFSVPAGSLDRWKDRCARAASPFRMWSRSSARTPSRVTDLGLDFELVASDRGRETPSSPNFGSTS